MHCSRQCGWALSVILVTPGLTADIFLMASSLTMAPSTWLAIHHSVVNTVEWKPMELWFSWVTYHFGPPLFFVSSQQSIFSVRIDLFCRLYLHAAPEGPCEQSSWGWVVNLWTFFSRWRKLFASPVRCPFLKRNKYLNISVMKSMSQSSLLPCLVKTIGWMTS